VWRKVLCIISCSLSWVTLSLFLCSLVSIHIGYLTTDISVLTKFRCFISHISLVYHSPSFHSHQYLSYLTCKFLVINLFNFFRHYKLPPFHTVIRIHLISHSYRILVYFAISFYLSGANVNVNNDLDITFNCCDTYSEIVSSVVVCGICFDWCRSYRLTVTKYLSSL